MEGLEELISLVPKTQYRRRLSTLCFLSNFESFKWAINDGFIRVVLVVVGICWTTGDILKFISQSTFCQSLLLIILWFHFSRLLDKFYCLFNKHQTKSLVSHSKNHKMPALPVVSLKEENYPGNNEEKASDNIIPAVVASVILVIIRTWSKVYLFSESINKIYNS